MELCSDTDADPITYVTLRDDRPKVTTCGQLFLSGAGSDPSSLTLQYKTTSACSPPTPGDSPFVSLDIPRSELLNPHAF
jgi:hypothetical protein